MKYKITFLLDKTNLWFEKQLRNYDFKLNNKYIFKISKNPNNIKNQDIVFPLSYTKILTESFLEKNNLVLIVHPSKLPKDKGFASLQYQILRNKNKVFMSLIKAEKKIDAGPIYSQNSFILDGTELSDEIRHIQGLKSLDIMHRFLIKYPKIKSRKQSGRSNFNKRRYHEDSELNVNKTIKQQFNNLRINDNKFYPSFFYFKGKKYIIKIFKEINKIKSTAAISVRSAKIDDSKLLLKIHNISKQAGFFSSNNTITFKDHVEWFKNKMKSNSKVYIGKIYKKKKDFGYVRFDETKNKIYQVSIGNLPNFYGKGLGSLMLEMAIKKFIKNDKPKKITCTIKKFNIRSYKCFLNNGFVKTKFDQKKHFIINKINPKKEDYFELTNPKII